MSDYAEWIAWVERSDESGWFRFPCTVIGESVTRYRIRADEPINLGGQRRVIDPGEVAWVPKHTVAPRPP